MTNCHAEEFSTQTFSAGISQRQLTVRGEKRTFWLYRPPGHTVEEKLPLIIAMHGFLLHSRLMMEVTELNQLADQHHCLIAYPDMAFLWQFSLPPSFYNKDSAFIEELIDKLVESEDVDPARVYATGFSNGADILHLFACSLSLSRKIAAFAPVCSNLDRAWASAIEHKKPVPMLMISGTADRFNRWEGDLDRWMSVADTFEYWQSHNGIAPSSTSLLFPAGNETKSATAAQFIQSFNQDGCEVSLLKIQGGGHTWPARRAETWYSRMVLGRMHREHYASDVIWSFFNRHHIVTRSGKAALAQAKPVQVR